LSNVKDILVSWRRRLKSAGLMAFGSWFLWLFSGVLGKRRTDGFLKGKLLPLSISGSIFGECCIVGVKCLVVVLSSLFSIL